MSVFIDRLKKLTRTEPGGIGFRRETPASASKKIQLVALVSGSENEYTGADALLIGVQEKKFSPDLVSGIPDDLPRGGWLESGGRKEVKQLKDAGCDFLVFPADGTPLAIIEEKDIGRIIEIRTDISDPVLRSVVELPVDAVLISAGQDKPGLLTWQDLMVLRRFANIPDKPLLARIPSGTSRGEIEALWEAGVSAVVTDGNSGKLREIIDKADFTSRKQEKTEPVLKQPEVE